MPALVTKEELEFYHEQGYLLKKGVFAEDELQELTNEYTKIWFDMLAAGEIVQKPEKPIDSLFPRLRDHYRTSDYVRQFSVHPAITGIVEDLIGEEPVVVQSTYYIKAPKTRGIPIHQDNYDMGIAPGTTYSAWLSVNASDRENGGLYVIPKTHTYNLVVPHITHNVDRYELSEIYDLPESYEIVDLSTEPGDMVFFNGNLIHGSYNNATENRFRQSFVVHYAGASLERTSVNYNYLLDKQGNRIRRRLNLEPKAVATQGPIFTWKDKGYVY
ncbi:phytanoyl-CoA dioxygenase family protein [Paenibacillus tarimensis]|uniref:phytanoyl-CoA dioxygenase family protein n=1 Tax=Paenibacillus tarimensis TaxID=416012 RepID=UPI001F1EBBC8|nr:phytanoyl-CoA dioxygenase family protein [Paenibacillus tarimensis]MCF2945194.1 phytanoyl-CoA dioxygenase family protein [Paenibacillus tarimensis]